MRTRLASWLLIVVAAISSPPLLACPLKQKPIPSEADRYSQIFVGEVIGVRLTGYLKDRNKIDQGQYYTDTTPTHDLEIIPIKTLKGKVSKLVTLSAGGCGVREPAPRDVGLFAVQPDGLVYPLYQGERSYNETLIDITWCVAGKCAPGDR